MVKKTIVYRKTFYPYFFLIPLFLVLISIVLFPLFYSLYLSFTSFSLIKVGSKILIGLKNYREIFSSSLFYKVLINNVIFLTVVVNTEFFLGLGIAVLLNFRFRGYQIMRTLLMMPMMFAPVLVGLQFRWIFNDQFGLLNNLLVTLGLIERPIAWLVGSKSAMIAVMATEVWQNTSFMAIVLLAGLSALPTEPFEAARVDGASSFQIFQHLTLPMLKPIILIALVIRSLDAIRVFDIIQMMTDGGPAYRTELLGTLVYRIAIVNARFGYGCAMSYIAILLSVFFAVLLFGQLYKTRL